MNTQFYRVIKKVGKNGMRAFRNFDSLEDCHSYALEQTKKYKRLTCSIYSMEKIGDLDLYTQNFITVIK